MNRRDALLMLAMFALIALSAALMQADRVTE
jgi:hypothetical protein